MRKKEFDDEFIYDTVVDEVEYYYKHSTPTVSRMASDFYNVTVYFWCDGKQRDMIHVQLEIDEIRTLHQQIEEKIKDTVKKQ